METSTSIGNNNPATPLVAKMTGGNDRDWHAYLSACREIAKNTALDARQMLAMKRSCALAYLDKRAQNESGAYSKTQVRTLTPEFVQLMATSNTAQRFKRCPWLEHLLSLPDEIGEAQDRVSPRGKVLSIVNVKHPAQMQLPRAN